MPTNRLNISLNSSDIKDLNKIRQELTRINDTETYSYVDIVRILIKFGRSYPNTIVDKA